MSLCSVARTSSQEKHRLYIHLHHAGHISPVSANLENQSAPQTPSPQAAGGLIWDLDLQVIEKKWVQREGCCLANFQGYCCCCYCLPCPCCKTHCCPTVQDLPLFFPEPDAAHAQRVAGVHAQCEIWTLHFDMGYNRKRRQWEIAWTVSRKTHQPDCHMLLTHQKFAGWFDVSSEGSSLFLLLCNAGVLTY